MQAMIRATETLKIPYKYEQNRVSSDPPKFEQETNCTSCQSTVPFDNLKCVITELFYNALSR